MVWEDRRGADADIRAGRFDAEAAPVTGWPADGLVVCGAAGDQTRPQLHVLGGAIQICWEDRRDGGRDIGMQRLTLGGALASGWPADGHLISTAPGDQLQPQIAPDGADGSYVVWLDTRSGMRTDLFAQKVAPDGALGWPADGYGVVAGLGNCSEPSIAAYGGDGCLVVWCDTRNDAGDVYVSRLLPASGVPSDVRDVTSSHLAIDVWPNPSRAGLQFAWQLSEAQRIAIEVFDARGRRVQAWSPGLLGSGRHLRQWDGRDLDGARLAAGVYWIRVRGVGVGNVEGTRKVVLRR